MRIKPGPKSPAMAGPACDSDPQPRRKPDGVACFPRTTPELICTATHVSGTATLIGQAPLVKPEWRRFQEALEDLLLPSLVGILDKHLDRFKDLVPDRRHVFRRLPQGTIHRCCFALYIFRRLQSIPFATHKPREGRLLDFWIVVMNFMCHVEPP